MKLAQSRIKDSYKVNIHGKEEQQHMSNPVYYVYFLMRGNWQQAGMLRRQSDCDMMFCVNFCIDWMKDLRVAKREFTNWCRIPLCNFNSLMLFICEAHDLWDFFRNKNWSPSFIIYRAPPASQSPWCGECASPFLSRWELFETRDVSFWMVFEQRSFGVDGVLKVLHFMSMTVEWILL